MVTPIEPESKTIAGPLLAETHAGAAASQDVQAWAASEGVDLVTALADLLGLWAEDDTPAQ